MKQDLMNHFPGWCLDFASHPENYYLVLSDDMDSFYSCKYLKKRFNAEIGGYYAFGKGLFLTEKAKKENRNLIYVDCSVVRDGVMCFDNHRTLITNHMAINPNMITDRASSDNYFKKYCGSTLMLLYALYHGELSELEKDFVIAIDGFYIGWYRENGRFRNVNQYWLELLDLSESLTPVLEKHDMQYYIDLIAKYQLKEKIYIKKNKLFTFADILPDDLFYMEMPTLMKSVSKENISKLTVTDKTVFTAAETFDCSYVCDFLL